MTPLNQGIPHSPPLKTRYINNHNRLLTKNLKLVYKTHPYNKSVPMQNQKEKTYVQAKPTMLSLPTTLHP